MTSPGYRHRSVPAALAAVLLLVATAGCQTANPAEAGTDQQASAEPSPSDSPTPGPTRPASAQLAAAVRATSTQNFAFTVTFVGSNVSGIYDAATKGARSGDYEQTVIGNDCWEQTGTGTYKHFLVDHLTGRHAARVSAFDPTSAFDLLRHATGTSVSGNRKIIGLVDLTKAVDSKSPAHRLASAVRTSEPRLARQVTFTVTLDRQGRVSTFAIGVTGDASQGPTVPGGYFLRINSYGLTSKVNKPIGKISEASSNEYR